MGILKRAWKSATRGVKRKANKLHEKSRKFYRGSGLKKVVSYAPLVGSAVGAAASAVTKDPRFMKIGADIGEATKNALSGNFKKALEVVEDNLSSDAKENVSKLKQQFTDAKNQAVDTFNKVDNVTQDVEDFGKNVSKGDLGTALNTVEKYMSPEQKKTLDDAILSGQELKEDAQNLVNNLETASKKGPEFFKKLNEKKIQLTDAVTGDSMYVDGFEGLKTKAQKLLDEGKENLSNRIEGVQETMKQLKSADLLPTEITPTDAEEMKDPEKNNMQVESLKELGELVNTDKMESEILNESQDNGSSFSKILRGDNIDEN